MATIDSAAFLARARAAVGLARYPQGMCLNFVWLMAGAIQSIPPALGRMDTAQHAWEAVEEKDRHHGDWNPPAGVAVFFGPSPTRTDRNKNAGDVAVSIGGGLIIATDASGAVVGVMTIAARAKQTQRPYLGWSETLGGHRFSAAAVLVAPAELHEAIQIVKKEYDMARPTLITTEKGQWLELSGNIIPFTRPDQVGSFTRRHADHYDTLEISDALARELVKVSQGKA